MSLRDAIVVGAGPAGSAAAGALAAAGWDVVLLEAERSPRHKLCGEFLSPESRSSLARLGLLNAVEACRPATVTTATVRSRLGSSVQLQLPAVGWGLSRLRLDGVLANAAGQAGAEVRYGNRVLGFEPVAGGFEVRVASRTAAPSTTLRARALLWATGRAGDGAGRSRAVAVKQHYAGSLLPPRVELHFFGGGYVGLNPVEGEQANVCVLASHATFVRAGRAPQRLLDWAIDSSPALRAQLAGLQPVAGTLKSKVPVGPTRNATPWDRTARIGDSVASIAPLCGDGIAMALRSAELCVPGADAYLRGVSTLVAWERQYRRAWRAECEARCSTGRFLQALLGMPLLADALILAGRAVPSLGHYLFTATRGSVHAAGASGLG